MQKLIKAVLQVMEECEGIEKSMTVGSGRNSYKGVSDKDVKLKIGGAMRRNGLIILPTEVNPIHELNSWEQEYKKEVSRKQSIFTQVTTKYLLCHESGETVVLAGAGQGVDSQDKGMGKASTYALKYTLLYTFLVATGHIDDADNTHSDEIPTAKLKSITPTVMNNLKQSIAKGATKNDLVEVNKILANTGYRELTEEQFKSISK